MTEIDHLYECFHILNKMWIKIIATIIFPLLSMTLLIFKIILFYGFDHVFRRPGILVLINDSDWELMVLNSSVLEFEMPNCLITFFYNIFIFREKQNMSFKKMIKLFLYQHFMVDSLSSDGDIHLKS